MTKGRALYRKYVDLYHANPYGSPKRLVGDRVTDILHNEGPYATLEWANEMARLIKMLKKDLMRLPIETDRSVPEVSK